MSGLLTMPELGAELPVPKDTTTEEFDQRVLTWRAVRARRLEMERAAREVEKEEKILFNWLCSVLKEQGRDGTVVGGRATGLLKGSVPTIMDKSTFLDYVRKSGNLFLLECRLSKKGVEEATEAGEEVPGIEFVETFDLYDRKV